MLLLLVSVIAVHSRLPSIRFPPLLAVFRRQWAPNPSYNLPSVRMPGARRALRLPIKACDALVSSVQNEAGR